MQVRAAAVVFYLLGKLQVEGGKNPQRLNRSNVGGPR